MIIFSVTDSHSWGDTSAFIISTLGERSWESTVPFKSPLLKFVVRLFIQLILMDLTSGHLHLYDLFPVATPIPGGDQQTHPEDDWDHLRYDYDHLMPVHGRGLIRPTPPIPQLFRTYNPDPVFFNSIPPVVGAHVEHLGSQDTVDWYICDLDTYILLLDLTLSDVDVSDPASADPTNASYYLMSPNREGQESHLALQPFSMPPPCVGEYENAISCDVDYTSPAEIWSHLDVDDDGACVCLWRDVLGEVCGFRSSANHVKRHLRRVHFELK